MVISERKPRVKKSGTFIGASFRQRFSTINLADHIMLVVGMKRVFGLCQMATNSVFTLKTTVMPSSPRRDFVDQRMLRLKEGGLVDMWFSLYYRGYNERDDVKNEDEKIGLKHLIQVFYALYIFHSISFVVLLCELFFNFKLLNREQNGFEI